MNTYIVRFKQVAAMTGIALSSIGGSGAMTPASALTFDFRPVAGTSQAAIDGFKAAGDRWSSVFTDAVTINIDIGFTPLDPGVLGQTGSQSQRYDYARVDKALLADRTSATIDWQLPILLLDRHLTSYSIALLIIRMDLGVPLLI